MGWVSLIVLAIDVKEATDDNASVNSHHVKFRSAAIKPIFMAQAYCNPNRSAQSILCQEYQELQEAKDRGHPFSTVRVKFRRP